MASWASKRPANAKRITLSLTDDMKNMLVKTKATTGKSFSFQLNEALRGLSSSSPPVAPPQSLVPPSGPISSPTVPDRGRQTSLPSKYAGMREQKIDRNNIPWKV